MFLWMGMRVLDGLDEIGRVEGLEDTEGLWVVRDLGLTMRGYENKRLERRQWK